MPRTRLSTKGPQIALPGYDVDTAPLSKMAFTPEAVAMRLLHTGTVSVTPFAGYMDNYYYRAIGYFPQPLLRLPIVLVAGINPDGSVEQRPFMYGRAESSTMRVVPSVEVRTFLDRVEIYVLVRNGPRPDLVPVTRHPPVWRYFIFQNTLEVA